MSRIKTAKTVAPARLGETHGLDNNQMMSATYLIYGYLAYIYMYTYMLYFINIYIYSINLNQH